MRDQEGGLWQQGKGRRKLARRGGRSCYYYGIWVRNIDGRWGSILKRGERNAMRKRGMGRGKAFLQWKNSKKIGSPLREGEKPQQYLPYEIITL